jgi:beta-galactosidase
MNSPSHLSLYAGRPGRITAAILLLLGSLALGSPAFEARAAEVSVDARIPAEPPGPLPFPVYGASPSGPQFSANRRYLTLGSQPWFPVMGEFHFSRYPADEWEEELRKMKAGGITVVSTYVFWIHHEETVGRFDWTGQRDLRRFVALCGKCGLYAWVRIGPWDHGEVRNGGFPDWLQKTGARSNDPAYLSRVARFYGEIGRQLQGQFWKDGGPIVGVQIENEYHPATGAVAHLQRLRAMAIAAGIDAPYFTMTGWDRSPVPETGFLPVFGGYTEEFWSRSRGELPPNQNFFFTRIRAEDNVMGDLQPKNPAIGRSYAGFPFLTAEMGGGMAIAYHRRPVMLADDSAAAALVKLGAGITGLGYYMYHGGINPDGLTSLQETQAVWNGYNDMEEKSYDFQAPLGERGQQNPGFGPIKLINLFLADYGRDLAPMTVYSGTPGPVNLQDRSTPRVAARFGDGRGFVFINNYERSYPLAELREFQVKLQLPGESIAIPRRPVTLPSGAYAIWPVNLSLGTTTLQYATAEPLCRIGEPATLVFFAWPGVRTEFAFRIGAGDQLRAPGAGISTEGGITYVTPRPEPDDASAPGEPMWLSRAGQQELQILVLSRRQALNLWKGSPGGRERLWLSPAGLFFDATRVHLYGSNPADSVIGAYPALDKGLSDFRPIGKNGVFQQYALRVPVPRANVRLTPTSPAAPAPAVQLGARSVAVAPVAAAFAGAAAWSIGIDLPAVPVGARPVLRIDYVGDVARLYAGNRLLDDNFYKGTPFEFGLWRLTPAELQAGLELRILPLRADAPIYLPPGARPEFGPSGEALQLKRVSVEWMYTAAATVAP